MVYLPAGFLPAGVSDEDGYQAWGNREHSFPTPADTGLVLAFAHLLAFCKSAVLQEKALSQRLPALENLN